MVTAGICILGTDKNPPPSSSGTHPHPRPLWLPCVPSLLPPRSPLLALWRTNTQKKPFPPSSNLTRVSNFDSPLLEIEGGERVSGGSSLAALVVVASGGDIDRGWRWRMKFSTFFLCLDIFVSPIPMLVFCHSSLAMYNSLSVVKSHSESQHHGRCSSQKNS